MKIKACKKCGKQARPTPVMLDVVTGGYIYTCACGEKPQIFDWTREEAIERWNEECGA